MADVDRIKNLAKLARKLKSLQNEMRRKSAVSVRVGYTANYALFVHENVEMKWKGKPRDHSLWIDAGGFGRNKKGSFASINRRGRYWDPQGKAQAKFLEEPARKMRDTLGQIISSIVAKTGNFETAFKTAGLRLQRESQKLVPVDTGNLKNSAFTRVVYDYRGVVKK